MFGLGATELFIIFLIIFLLFGAKNIPEIAKGMGKALRLFKKGVHDIEDEFQTTHCDIEESLEDKKIEDEGRETNISKLKNEKSHSLKKGRNHASNKDIN